MPSARLTKTAIAALKLPRSGNQVLYQDAEQDGLAVRVTSNGARSFIVDRNTTRGRIRITLGPAGTDELTVPRAREQARIALGLIGQGYTREQVEERLARAEDRIPSGAVTLEQVFTRYLARRRHKLSERTRSDYRQLVDTHLADWKARPVELLDEEAVLAKFHSIKSPSRANYVMRLLRALFRSARRIKNDEGEPIIDANPVDALTDEDLWHDVPPRRDVIKLNEFSAWWKAVEGLAVNGEDVKRADNGRFAEGTAAVNARPEVVRDYLQFLLLTGLRRNEAARLKWADVDMAGRMFTVTQTKNRQPHTLPLSDYLLELLQRREADGGEYVFPGESGPLAEPKRQIEKVTAASSVVFTAHTLRRTFATIAESLDIPYYALKRLLNHRVADVTGQHYTVITVERLREPMQKVTDFILKAAGVRESAPVVASKSRRRV